MWAARCLALTTTSCRRPRLLLPDGALEPGVAPLHVLARVDATSWARNHHLHHKVTGNRDQSLFRWSDTVYVTKQQLAAKPLWVQRAYRLLRHPAVFLWFGPLMNWFVDYRLPHSGLRAPRVSPRLRGFVNVMPMTLRGDMGAGAGARRRRGQRVTRLSLVACAAVTPNPAVVLWGRQVEKGWSKENASLKGASILPVPWCLKWFTMGIECALPASPRLASPR